MQHRIHKDDNPDNDYVSLSDKEKNTRLLAHLCQVIENTAIDGKITDTTVAFIKATALCFNVSIQFNANDNVMDIKERLIAILGEDEEE